jgi:flagellar motor switch protein FliN/FliY
MSDGAISQDEIDALLAGVDMGGMGASSAAPSQSFSDAQANALKGFLSGNLGALKSNLESMTAKSAEYGAPVIEVMNRDSFLRKIPEMVVASLVDFSETLVGDHLFVLSPEFAQKLVSLVNNEESAELDDMALPLSGDGLPAHGDRDYVDREGGSQGRREQARRVRPRPEGHGPVPPGRLRRFHVSRDP